MEVEALKKRKQNPTLPDIFERYGENREVQLGIKLESMNRQLGRYFRETRTNSGISMETVARELTLSPRRLAEWETGGELHKLPILVVIEWARRLGLEISFSVKPHGNKSKRSL